MDSWGPSTTQQRKRRSKWWWARLAITLLALDGVLKSRDHVTVMQVVTGICQWLVIGMIAFWIYKRAAGPLHLPLPNLKRPRPVSTDPLTEMRDRARRGGNGVYLGLTKEGEPQFSRAERAVLLLGPPRSGKTSGVIIPTLLTHTGPAVSTSTETDVFKATRRTRAAAGQLWMFDPTGSGMTSDGATELRWSPVSGALSWDGAVLIARAMTANIGAGTTDRSHWSTRAQALLAPLLHAAAVHGRDMEAVVDWVMRHELDEAGVLLEDERCSRLAFGNLLGLLNTEDRERSSIFSAAADALQAYGSEHALVVARDPNFDPDTFVRSNDTVYINAPGEAQGAVAPLVCGLLAEIRRATYQAHAHTQLRSRLLFALDEVANIAPLEELPQIASEGGGQGLVLLAALQDLSQARRRWGVQADGFLTLFGTKLILPGVADPRTLETVSTMLGEYDREVISRTRPHSSFLDLLSKQSSGHSSSTTSTQRTRVLSPGEVANIPSGSALHLDGVRWERVRVTPAHASEPWRTLISGAAS